MRITIPSSLYILSLQILFQQPYLISSQCDPCTTISPTYTGYKIKPSTNCIEYIQCTDGVTTSEMECAEGTVFDVLVQYCNWASSVTCVDDGGGDCPPTHPPSAAPIIVPSIPVDQLIPTDPLTPTDPTSSTSSDGELTLTESADCPNPCPPSYTGFQTRPGTSCSEYVQCDSGQVVGELGCFGDTIFNQAAQYCDWKGQTVCAHAECPKTERPTTSPTRGPTLAPVTEKPITASPVLTIPIVINTAPTQSPSEPPIESADCPNPCPPEHTGLQTRPGTQCKKYVQCTDGIIISEYECFGEMMFIKEKGYCDTNVIVSWENNGVDGGGEVSRVVECEPVVCPAQPPSAGPSDAPSHIPSGVPSISLAPTATSASPASPGSNWTNPSPSNEDLSKLEVGENETNVTIAMDVSMPPTSSSTTFEIEFSLSTDPPTTSPTRPPTPFPTTPPTAPPTLRPSLPPTLTPTTSPTTVYPRYKQFLFDRQDIMNRTIFYSSYWKRATQEYVIGYFVSALDIVVYQLPPEEMFFVGQYLERYHRSEFYDDDSYGSDKDGDTDGQLGGIFDSQPTTNNGPITGLEYGLVNLAAFLANAMSEGLHYDSCNEWNTHSTPFTPNSDEFSGRFPLSNACGQYGRLYQDESCTENDDVEFRCEILEDMEIVASDGPLGPSEASTVAETRAQVWAGDGPPPFMCGVMESGAFPGFYDEVVGEVVESPYANKVGRTDVEGCCWWGRGILLTKGTCTLAKLNAFLGKKAFDAGSYSRYPDIDFCLTPNAICDNFRTAELRWVIGLTEWAHRMQSYEYTGNGGNNDPNWRYMQELKKFVDGKMVDESFFDRVVNVFVRGCHTGGCNNYEILHAEERKNNFKKIIFDVFELPLPEPVVKTPMAPSVPSGPKVDTAPDVGPAPSMPFIPGGSSPSAPMPSSGQGGGKNKGERDKVDLTGLPPSSGGRWKPRHFCFSIAFLLQTTVMLFP